MVSTGRWSETEILFIWGEFTQICGVARNRLAAVNVSTGQLTIWNLNADNVVYALALSGSDLYAGGDFTNIGGQNWNIIAAIHTTDGTATN
jgi:hypothetical protein